MEDAARAIVVQEATLVKEAAITIDGETASIWQSPVYRQPSLTAYWMGPDTLDSTRIVAYRVAEPSGLPGGYPALEMKRAWVCRGLRGRGVSSGLMREMARHRQSFLVADREGVTAAGYEPWVKSSGWQRLYWDQQQMDVVPVDAAPEADRFSDTKEARRWALVLVLDSLLQTYPALQF